MSSRPTRADVRLEQQVKVQAEQLRMLRALVMKLGKEVNRLANRVIDLENP